MSKKNAAKMIAAVLVFAFVFSSCSNFALFSSIDDLISPVAPSGDNAEIQSAVDEFCKGGYSIKIPAAGDYTTSFITKDIDGDNENEAIAFYEPSNKLGTICMAVLKKTDGVWSVIDSVENNATDINSVDFCDFDGDGTDEIIVCRSIVSKTTGTSITVYNLSLTNSDYKLKSISKSIDGSNFVCADINEDGVKDLLVFATGNSSESPRAELYTFENSKKKLIGETRLDSTITSFESISYSDTDEGLSVYADAVCGDGSYMVTEFIYWSDYYDSIISPFYSYSTARTKETMRSESIVCRDIDNDGVIEIPSDATIKSDSEEISAQEWLIYGNTVLSHKCYSCSCRRDGYMIVIPDKYFKKVKVSYNADKRSLKLKIKKTDDLLLEVITLLSTDYNSDSQKYKGYSVILKDSGFVYLAKVSNDFADEINNNSLKNIIKILATCKSTEKQK